MKNVLIVVAHPDDEMLGMGGTLHALVGQKCNVEVWFMTEGNRPCEHINGVTYTLGNLPDQGLTTNDVKSQVAILEKYISKNPTDVIFTHCENDLNMDHQIVRQIVLTACRPESNVIPTPNKPGIILGLKHEIHGFNPNVFLPFEESHLYCTESSLNEYDINKNELASQYEAKSICYGTKTDGKYADGFELIYSNSRSLIF